VSDGGVDDLSDAEAIDGDDESAELEGDTEVEDDSEAEGEDEAERDPNQLPVPTAVAVLEYLAKALVADPDEVRVEIDESDGLTLNVSVADGDLGRVIGRRGRVANATRAIARAAAAKDGESRVAIEFVD